MKTSFYDEKTVILKDALKNENTPIKGAIPLINKGTSSQCEKQKIIDQWGQLAIGYEQNNTENNCNYWLYTPSENSLLKASNLNANETLLNTYIFKGPNDTAGRVTIVIKGSNHSPIISGKSVGAVIVNDPVKPIVNADGNILYAGGSLRVQDLDHGESGCRHMHIDSEFSSFSILPNCSWAYLGKNNHLKQQALKSNETLNETFKISTIDKTPHNITITTTYGKKHDLLQKVYEGSHPPSTKSPVTTTLNYQKTGFEVFLEGVLTTEKVIFGVGLTILTILLMLCCISPKSKC